MARKKAIAFSLVILLLLLLAGAVWAAQSAGPGINWSVMSGGGAPAAAAGVTINGSIGQPVAGSSSTSGSGLSLSPGYWYRELKAQFQLHLPAVLR